MVKRPWVVLLMTSTVLFCGNNNPFDTSTVPDVTRQPRSQVILQGSQAVFSVSIAGDPAPACQWYRDGVQMPGDTDSVLTIPAVDFSDTGTYWVVLSNPKGTEMSDSATLTVYTLTILPLSDTVSVDSAFSFTATVSGIPNPTYQWRWNGFNISGATSLTYSKAAALLEDAGTYQLIVSGAADDVYSEPVMLVVNP